MTFPKVGHVLLASLVMTMASVAFSDTLAGAPSTEISKKDAEKMVKDVKSGTRTVLLMVNFPSVGNLKQVKFAIISGTPASTTYRGYPDLTKAVVFETAKQANTLLLYKAVLLQDKWPQLKAFKSGILAAILDADGSTPYLLIGKKTTLYRFNLRNPQAVPLLMTLSPGPSFAYTAVLFATSGKMTLDVLSFKTEDSSSMPNPIGVTRMASFKFVGDSLATSQKVKTVMKKRYLCQGSSDLTFRLQTAQCPNRQYAPWRITSGFINKNSVFLFDAVSKSVFKFPHDRLSSKDGKTIKYQTIQLKEYFKFSANPVTQADIAKPETTDISIRTWIYVIVSLISVVVFLALLIAVIGCVLCRKADAKAKKQQQGPNRGSTGAGGSSMGVKADGSSMDVKSQLPGSKVAIPKCATKSSLGPPNIGAGQPKVGKQGSAMKVGKMKQGGHN